MEIDDNKEPKDDFITDIEEYCDNWCEKCLYTKECKEFAKNKLMWAEIAEDIKREKLIGSNKDMWDQMNNLMEEVAYFVDNDSSSSDHQENDEATIYFNKQLAKAKDHKLTKIALKYEQTVENWFDKNDNKLLVFNKATIDYDFVYPGINDKVELKKLFDSAEIIRWYIHLLSTKIERAIMSSYLEEDGQITDWTSKDSDGSAMIAIISIDKSLTAWYHFCSKLIPEKESMESIIRMLLWLRMEMEKMFPKAIDFVWPPKINR